MSMEKAKWEWKLLLGIALSFYILVVAFSYEDFPSQDSRGSVKKVKDGCKMCENKVEDRDEFVCCGDCTYPDMVYSDTHTSSGYCKTGAELISQPKPKEVFEWVVGAWLPSSAPCGGGIRSRRVDCYAVMEETSSPDYPVYDYQCSSYQQKPITRETCNLQNCIEDVVSKGKEKKRKSKWMIAFLIFVGFIALGFAAFVFYTRKTSGGEPGYVYIMMEGFS